MGGQPFLFPGFSLAIFDLPNGKTTDEWNREVSYVVQCPSTTL